MPSNCTAAFCGSSSQALINIFFFFFLEGTNYILLLYWHSFPLQIEMNLITLHNFPCLKQETLEVSIINSAVIAALNILAIFNLIRRISFIIFFLLENKISFSTCNVIKERAYNLIAMGLISLLLQFMEHKQGSDGRIKHFCHINGTSGRGYTSIVFVIKEWAYNLITMAIVFIAFYFN